jgi:hypothetical protein
MANYNTQYLINTLNHNEILEIWNEMVSEDTDLLSVFENTFESFDQFLNVPNYYLAKLIANGSYSTEHTYVRVHDDKIESSFYLDKLIDLDKLTGFVNQSEKWIKFIDDLNL